MEKKIDFKLTGLRVVWFDEVMFQVEILKLRESNINQSIHFEMYVYM